MKKVIIISLLGLFAALETQGQQRVQYSQYLQNSYLMGPAQSGIEDYVDVKAGFRQQWSGLDGGPQSFYLTAHAPLGAPRKSINYLPVRGRSAAKSAEMSASKLSASVAQKLRHGIGGTLQTDKFGATTLTALTGSYALHVSLNEKVKIAAGAAVGALFYRLDGSKLNIVNPNDNLIQGANTTILPSLDMNVLLYSEKFFVSYTGTQLLRSKLKFTDIDAARDGRLHLHHYLTAGYKFNLSENISLTPSAMVRYMNPAPASMDYSLRAAYQNKYWIGASVRQSNAMVFMAGFDIGKQLSLGYSYDMATGELSNVFGASHEIVISGKLPQFGAAPVRKFFW